MSSVADRAGLVASERYLLTLLHFTLFCHFLLARGETTTTVHQWPKIHCISSYRFQTWVRSGWVYLILRLCFPFATVIWKVSFPFHQTRIILHILSSTVHLIFTKSHKKKLISLKKDLLVEKKLLFTSALRRGISKLQRTITRIHFYFCRYDLSSFISY